MSEIIWAVEDSMEEYEARVVRIDTTRGILQLLKDNVIIREENVTLMFGAIFGPDVADANQWLETITQWTGEITEKEEAND